MAKANSEELESAGQPADAAGARAGLAEQTGEGLLQQLLAGPLKTNIDKVSKNVSPKDETRRKKVEGLIQTLLKEVLSGTAVISDDWAKTIRDLIAVIDQKLTDQVNAIIHDPEFQKLEGSWRGLHKLVMESELSTELKVRVLDVSKDEVAKSFSKYPGAKWDQSPLYKKIYGGEFDVLRGEPYGCIIGDYEFTHSARDVGILAGMAQISAAAHAPFLAAASPELMNMQNWEEVNNPPDIKKLFGGGDYAAWRALRESEDSRFIGLTMPRYMARLPYSNRDNPVESFAFDEDAQGPDQGKYTWSNAAYAMGLNINQAFAADGWTVRIVGVEGGGRVEKLPCHTFGAQDGGVDMKCPTEVQIGQQREKELADCGLIPLIHAKNTNFAAFIGAQSLQKPKEYTSAEATANAKLSARLPYLFASCRFAHYLKKMVYEKVGTIGMSRDKVERWLNDWIIQYVHGDPLNAPESALAERPLAEARVEVTDIEGDPGAYNARFFLRPHYLLDSMNIALSLVSKIPTGKK